MKEGYRMATSAGWFEDPESAQHWRWWDGSGWGPRVEKRPAGDQPALPASAPAEKPFARGTRVVANKWASGVLVVGALVVLWGLGIGESDDPTPTNAPAQPPSPPSSVSPPPPPETEPEPETLSLSAEGDGNTAPFTLAGGDYVVTATFVSDCFYGLDLTGLDGQRGHDIGGASDPQTQETYIYGVEPGRYYIRTYTGPPPRCPWSVTFGRLP